MWYIGGVPARVTRPSTKVKSAVADCVLVRRHRQSSMSYGPSENIRVPWPMVYQYVGIDSLACPMDLAKI